MPRLNRSNPFGTVIRLLIAVGCLVPFTGPRQAAAALRLSPPVNLGQQLPGSPVEDDEEEQEESLAQKRLADSALPHSGERSRTTPGSWIDPSAVARPTSFAALPRPAPADPFRNGLGTHYRC